MIINYLCQWERDTNDPKIFQMQLSNTETIHSLIQTQREQAWTLKEGDGDYGPQEWAFSYLHLINLWMRIPSGVSRSFCPRFSTTCYKLQTSLKLIVINTEIAMNTHYATHRRKKKYHIEK